MYETVLERFPGWVLENFTEVHSRPQSPSFLSHVVGERGALDAAVTFRKFLTSGRACVEDKYNTAHAQK